MLSREERARMAYLMRQYPVQNVEDALQIVELRMLGKPEPEEKFKYYRRSVSRILWRGFDGPVDYVAYLHADVEPAASDYSETQEYESRAALLQEYKNTLTKNQRKWIDAVIALEQTKKVHSTGEHGIYQSILHLLRKHRVICLVGYLIQHHLNRYRGM